MKNIKKRIFFLIVIISVSLIYGLPDIILAFKLKESFTPLTTSGLSPIARDETYAYAPFIKYVLDGKFPLGDAYVLEYEKTHTPHLGETLPATIMAIAAKITGSIERSFVAADFIFPPIIFFILYKITRIFIRNNFLAVSASFLAVASRDFISVIPYPHEMFQLLTFAEGQNFLLYFSRAFHPQVSFIVFALSFFCTLKLVKNQSRFNMLATGIFTGLLFYTYVFYWTYQLFFLLILAIFLFLKKNFGALNALILSIFISLLIGSYYLLNIFQFNTLPIAKDFLAKTTLSDVPLPLTLFRYLLLFSALFYLTKRKSKQFQTFLIFLVTGVIISPVSKIILGQDLETFHYLRRALMPFATVSLILLIYLFIEKKTKVIKYLSIVIFVTFFLVSLRSQVIATTQITKAHVKNKSQDFVLKWLDQNTPKNSVVGSLDTDFNLLIPVKTKNKTYFPPTDRTVMPTSEGQLRYIALSNILGIEKQIQKDKLDKIISYLFIYQTYDGVKGVNFNSPKRIETESLIEKYYQNSDEILKMFKLDYVIVSSDQLANIHPNTGELKAVTSINGFIIFKVNEKTKI